LNQENQSDNSIHPVLKASMSTSTFDAVVPDILTFRLDKDDPLDMPKDQVVGDGRKKVEDLREKRMELIRTVISIIASRNINEAFEQVCCQSIHSASQSISYGLKG
jgi:hypothetical protein